MVRDPTWCDPGEDRWRWRLDVGTFCMFDDATPSCLPFRSWSSCIDNDRLFLKGDLTADRLPSAEGFGDDKIPSSSSPRRNNPRLSLRQKTCCRQARGNASGRPDAKGVHRWPRALPILSLIAFAVGAVGCGEDQGSNRSPDPPRSVSLGNTAMAPTLPRVDLHAIKRLIKEADEADEVLVIDFWATWCSPCVDLLPGLHTKLAEIDRGVRLVSITLDTPGLWEKKAIGFLQNHNALHDAYLLAPDQDKREKVVSGLGQRWRNLSVPAILIYGPDGRLVDEILGDRSGLEAVVITTVRRLLGESRVTYPDVGVAPL